MENNFAFVELEIGHVVSAGAWFQANLGVAAKLGDRWTIAECLEGIAAALSCMHRCALPGSGVAQRLSGSAAGSGRVGVALYTS